MDKKHEIMKAPVFFGIAIVSLFIANLLLSKDVVNAIDSWDAPFQVMLLLSMPLGFALAAISGHFRSNHRKSMMFWGYVYICVIISMFIVPGEFSKIGVILFFLLGLIGFSFLRGIQTFHEHF